MSEAKQGAVVAEGPSLPVKRVGVLRSEVAYSCLANVGHHRIGRKELGHTSEAFVREGRVHTSHLVGCVLTAQVVRDAPAVRVLATLDLERVLSFDEAPLNLEADTTLEGEHSTHGRSGR